MSQAKEPETWLFDACPGLPPARPGMSFRELRALGRRRDRWFYRTALDYAQCLWRRGLPAQAILQLDRAWGADLAPDDAVLEEWPSPYRALVWMLERRPEGRFLGNPVRHFQHLATRVKGERREVRSWRAWACFHLSERTLPLGDFPRDERQIAREGVVVPEVEKVRAALARGGWRSEAGQFEDCLRGEADRP